MTNQTILYLASQSPRRSELLTQLAVPFKVISASIDETQADSETAPDFVDRMACEKALAGMNTVNTETYPVGVLGADTVVVIDGEILGKPANNSDSRRMLRLLSAKTHQVMTAVALAIQSSPSAEVELNNIISVSNVSFKELSESEIDGYISTGEGVDKAGSYAIQGRGAVFITHLSGSYSGVMGLPLHETYELLNNAAIR